MKTLPCDLCDHKGQGETFEGWVQNMMPHYKEAHADVMGKMAEMDPREQEVEREKWMEKMRAEFEAAQEK